MTTYRASCGTHMGARLHQEAGEDLCGTCVAGEQYRLLTRELIPTRPTPPPPEYGDVSEFEAARNRRDLDAALTWGAA